MKLRVHVVAAEYSAPLSLVTCTPPSTYRRKPEDPPEAPDDSALVSMLWQRLFFSAPIEGQTWADIGAARPPSLTDLLASAAHRALGSFHHLLGHGRYSDTVRSISDLLVASMPLMGDMADSGVNAGLVPMMLRAGLGLEFDSHCQFVAGTADSGASAFASAVRIAQSRPATVLVAAGQLIPSGYMGQYRIRSVFVEEEQSQGLDMMAMGDALMDALRRTHAEEGFDLAECQRWLAEVRRRKHAAAAAYPAALGIMRGDPTRGDTFVTRYFRSADVAKSGCGAAAVVLTSDPDMLGRIRATLARRVPRFRNTPLVEIMGVGEGGTDPRLLGRRTPLAAVTPMRQALATAADHAELPLTVYPDSAFAIVHDAFPSMELAFLLAIGLDWQRACLRMTTWWSNPCGGLLAFGDAIGASGLVQVCKAFHVFTGDQRYIPEPLTALGHFRREGSYAFTASVGGPLSQVIVSILRGGVPPSARDQDAFFAESPHGGEHRQLAVHEQRRRRRLRDATRVYMQRLRAHAKGLYLIEAITEIDARSCAQALAPEDIDGLSLERLRGVIRDEHADTCCAEVIGLIHALRADYLAADSASALKEARERYNAGLARLLAEWTARELLRPDREMHAYLARTGLMPLTEPGGGEHDRAPDEEAAELMPPAGAMGRQHRLKALKQCIRVPMAFLIDPTTSRRMLYCASRIRARGADLDVADFVAFEPGKEPALCRDPEVLPWWNSRARRVLTQPRLGALETTEPDKVFDALLGPRSLHEECHPELVFLRAYFAPCGPQAAVDLAMRDLGVRPSINAEDQVDELVPAIFYKNDIIGSSSIVNVHEAYELLGRAVQRARGWFGMYASTCAQHGDSVSLVSLDWRLEPGSGDALREARHARAEAISNASRFARDVAEWCQGYGIRLRTVVSFGQGVAYRDVNDDRSVASDSAIRGARLLDHVADAAHEHGFAALPWIVFDWTELADIDDPVGIFERELLAASGPGWQVPTGPASPVALERWDDIRFTVWYRPDSPLPR